ncbi:UNVERIFIED_CONTAM: hypothetical protein Sindi_1455200 [Sesamum indicum]
MEQPTPRRRENPQIHQLESEYEEEVEPPHCCNRVGTRRQANEADRDLGSIKLTISTFQGRSDPEAYLEWEKKMDLMSVITTSRIRK